MRYRSNINYSQMEVATIDLAETRNSKCHGGILQFQLIRLIKTKNEVIDESNPFVIVSSVVPAG